MILTVIFTWILTKPSMATEGEITTETLKLRKEPSTDSIVLELMSIGEKVEVLEKQGDWYKVRYKEITGYAHQDYLKVEEEIEQKQPQEQITEQMPQETEQPIEENESTSTMTHMVTNTETMLYYTPRINASAVTSIKAQTQVEILERLEKWSYVTDDQSYGWIPNTTLSNTEPSIQKPQEQQPEETPTEEQPTQQEETEPTIQQEPTIGYINWESINVRKEPSTDAEVLGTLLLNTEVKVLSEEKDWCKIEYKEGFGYVAKRLISDSKTEVTSRGEVDRDGIEEVVSNQDANQEELLPKETTSVSNSVGEEIVSLAKQYLGYRYVYGGNSPSRGFDCSGFTKYIFSQFGYSLSHSATAQSKVGSYVSKAALELGDLVIFNDDANREIGHVGIYIGGNDFIHASNPSDGVKITSLSNSYYQARYVTARRMN